MRSISHVLTILFAASLVAALAWPAEVRAGACASFATTVLALVAPEAPIPLDPEVGPLLEEVEGDARVSSGERGRQPQIDALLTRVRVRGPRGAVRVTPRPLAPGIHRLEGSFRAGTHRLSGLEGRGSVEFVAGPAAPLPTPVIAQADHAETTQVYGGPRPGTTTLTSVEITLSTPAPAGAWMALLYAAAPSAIPRRAAIHSVQVEAGATRLNFSRASGSSSRCGPNLPMRGVPPAGASVQVAWLTRTGQLSPPSEPVAAP